MKREINRKGGKLLTQPGDLRHADGGSDGGVRDRGGCRWVEHLTMKGVGCVRARRRWSTASRGEPENGIPYTRYTNHALIL